MPENKTKPNAESVDSYLQSITNESRRDDAVELMKAINAVTRAEPVMWGSRIVGYGTYHYKYASGREGDTPAVGFSATKAAMTIYGIFDFEDSEENIELASRIGPHTHGAGCLYIKRLKDIDLEILSKMIRLAFSSRNNS